jgi:hypothetical protein
MNELSHIDNETYRVAMGRLLVMYTQVDHLIMRACAERIATAPDDDIRIKLGKQVGDESKHVRIQHEWMHRFGTDMTPVFSEQQQGLFLAHFRSLNWLDFLTDMYVCVEALGSEAVEQIVPLADPGTRESLKTPLEDEIDHVEFGLSQLTIELSKLPEHQRMEYIENIPSRLDSLKDALHGFGVDIPAMFAAVGVDYRQVVDKVLERREEILRSLALPRAA